MQNLPGKTSQRDQHHMQAARPGMIGQRHRIGNHEKGKQQQRSVTSLVGENFHHTGWHMAKVEQAQQDQAEEGGEEAHAAAKPKPAKRDPKLPPAYMPLDPFVVNLADRDADRYAQIGVTLEIDDPKFAEEMKPYMPAIRNAVLMILSHKTAAELQGREGKEQLAAEIAREVVRPMGINIDDESEDDGKKKRKRAPVYNPVQQVHFSSFIVQ